MGAQVMLPVCLYSPGSAKNVACGVSVAKPVLTHICLRLMGAACFVLCCPVLVRAVAGRGMQPCVGAGNGSSSTKPLESCWKLNGGDFLLEAATSRGDSGSEG